MSTATVKALMFDVFGTVVDWRSSVAREVQRQLEPRGVTVDWLAFAMRWRARYQPSMERVRSGERGWVKLDDLHRENLLEVLEEFGVEALPEAEIDRLNRVWHRLDPWPDVVEGLRRMKSGYIIATLSNGNVSLMVDLARHGGLAWDVILGAEIAGHYKPEPQAYERSAALLDLSGPECMLVAAHNGDLVAAAGCGFRTAFVTRPTEYGPEQRTDLAAEHDFDHVARDFLDLAGQLGV